MIVLAQIPFIGKALDRFYDAIIDDGIRRVRHMLCYKSFVDNLKSEVRKIEVQEKRVSSKVNEERNNGKIIQDHVMEWQKKVQDFKTLPDELSPSCNCFNLGMCPNPRTRFRLGREAKHQAKHVADLTASGVELLQNEIADLPDEPNMPISDTKYQKFNSRDEAYEKLQEALRKEDGPTVIGIYGMPGVGKTTMIEQAWEEAKEKIFDKVTRANVGAGNFDVIKLQKELAGHLVCHFQSEEHAMLRATQLKSSLNNAGKTLVILDDVWDKISLAEIGIPHDASISKGSKILLTSRRKDVCLDNNCTDPIEIQPLTEVEAWDLFKNTVATLENESLLKTSLPRKLCAECGGLPLLIHAVGNAIKFGTENSWKHALSQLENCNFDEIDGIKPKVYACIQLSFDRLKTDAKTCLLLCSLFAEDAEVEIKMLEDLATGSQLLSRGGNVDGVVDILKSSSLLLDGATHHTIKLHDIIRDVARSIAARDEKYAFLFIRGGSYLPDVVNCYSSRRLLQFVECNNYQFPTGMVCPDLHTLWLEGNNKPQQISNSFLEGIVNLKVLMLKGILVFPVQIFDNLTLLNLDGCSLNETSLSILPETIETLRILMCHIRDPLDLSRLKSLRKLEVVDYSQIKLVPNAISTLPSTLEKLHIPGGFRICDDERERSVPISLVLNKLTVVMTSLNIWLENSQSCPAEHVVANLLDFIIDVGDKATYKQRSLDSHMRSVCFKNTSIEGGGEFLVAKAEEVILEDVKGSVNGFSNSGGQAFSTLKRLDIKFCDDMEHLVACQPQYEIQQCQPLTSFSKLTSLRIAKCRGLKYLFTASVANCLLQLEEMFIKNCPALEAVIRNESAMDGVIIKFPKLKELTLQQLPSLGRFFHGENRGRNSSPTTIMENAAGSYSLFDGMVEFDALEKLTIWVLKTSDIWDKNCLNNNSFCQLESLRIWECAHLEYAIPVHMLGKFQNLAELDIRYCETMRSEVESSSSSNESSNEELPIALAFRAIRFWNLPVLTQTRLNSGRRNLYPYLEMMKINECHSLRNVFQPCVAKHLQHLEILRVEDCKMMSEIIGEEERKEEKIDEFVFPELTTLELTSLPNLQSFHFTETTGSQHRPYSALKVSFPKLVTLCFRATINLEEIVLGINNFTSEIKELTVDSGNGLQLPHKWQLQLPNIEKLDLINSWWNGSSGESNVGNFLFNPYGTLSFQNLKVIEVNKCGVSAMFSCSIFMNLPQILRLEVRSCPLLEEVVWDQNNVDGTNKETISLLQLESITLEDLPKLKSFSASRNCVFNMPALKYVTLRECPQIEYFTCLEINSPLIPDLNNKITDQPKGCEYLFMRPQ